MPPPNCLPDPATLFPPFLDKRPTIEGVAVNGGRRTTGVFLHPRLPLKVAQVMSPLGPILVAGDEKAVYLVEFRDRLMLENQVEVLRRRLGADFFSGTSPVIEQMRAELEAYFESGLRKFETPVGFSGTPFQERVWGALKDVPPGCTWSYAELARRAGSPKAVRAVGRAVGQNRLAIVLPCHRVIGSNGQLTGYAGGLERKRFLLAHEQGNGRSFFASFSPSDSSCASLDG